LVYLDGRAGSGGTQFTSILREVQRVWDDSRYTKSTAKLWEYIYATEPQSHRGSRIEDRRSKIE
jgi:hypothetical protein